MSRQNYSGLGPQNFLVDSTIQAPSGIEQAYQKLVTEMERLDGKTIDESIDLTRVLQDFADLGMQDLFEGCADPRRASPESFSCLVSGLGAHLGLAQGTVVVVNLLGRTYGVLSCDLLPGKVDHFEYLQVPLLVAQARMRSPDDINVGGFALRNLAVYDPARSKQDAAHGRKLISVLANCNERFAVHLLRRIESQKVSANEYADVCNVLALKMEEIQHAKDHIFCGFLMPDEINPSVRARELLRRDSALLQILNGQQDEFVHFSVMRGIVEYCGSLGGTIMAMATCINKERPDQALLAFDDFLWLTKMRSSAGEQGAYALEGRFFFMQLSHLIGERNATADGINALLHHTSADIHAQRALDMLQVLYRLDFYEDGERREIVDAKLGRGLESRADA